MKIVTGKNNKSKQIKSQYCIKRSYEHLFEIHSNSGI